MVQYIPVILTIFIAFCSLLVSIYTLISKNNKENTTELTTVIVKLENISGGIADIKTEMNTMKTDQKEDHDRLIQLESSVSALWKQFNNEVHKLESEIKKD